MNPEDPYRGLPSLTRLEADLESSERHLARGWASRHLRLIGGAGVALALGLGFSPVGPAFGGGNGSTEKGAVARTLPAKVVEAPGVSLALPVGEGKAGRLEPVAPVIKDGSGVAVETLSAGAPVKTERLRAAEAPGKLRARSHPFPPRVGETGPLPRGAARKLRRAVDDA